MSTKTYTCPQCGRDLPYDESENIYGVVTAHLSKCPSKPAAPAHKRITDILPPEVMKGDFVSIDDILEQELLVTDMVWQASSFKEGTDYLTLTLTIDGEERKLNTGASRVVEVFRAVKASDLPLYCALEKIQLPNGRRVYRVK